jgi:hypothetical protein
MGKGLAADVHMRLVEGIMPCDAARVGSHGTRLRQQLPCMASVS